MHRCERLFLILAVCCSALLIMISDAASSQDAAEDLYREARAGMPHQRIEYACYDSRLGFTIAGCQNATPPSVDLFKISSVAISHVELHHPTRPSSYRVLRPVTLLCRPVADGFECSSRVWFHYAGPVWDRVEVDRHYARAATHLLQGTVKIRGALAVHGDEHCGWVNRQLERIFRRLDHEKPRLARTTIVLGHRCRVLKFTSGAELDVCIESGFPHRCRLPERRGHYVEWLFFNILP